MCNSQGKTGLAGIWKADTKWVDRLIWEDTSQISRLGRWILMSLTETIVSGGAKAESWS